MKREEILSSLEGSAESFVELLKSHVSFVRFFNSSPERLPCSPSAVLGGPGRVRVFASSAAEDAVSSVGRSAAARQRRRRSPGGGRKLARRDF